MKKRTWLSALLALCMAVSMSALVACAEPEGPAEPDTPCTEHVDADGNGKCDVCGEEMAVTPGPEEYKVTDGVFNWSYDASHTMIVKLYEDGTFYAQGMDNTVVKGTYKEGTGAEVEYVDAGSDFVQNDPNPAEGDPTRDEWKTTTSYIDFFEADGVTPYPMQDTVSELYSGYADDVPTNRITYADGKLHNVCIGIATRTLSHNPLMDFSTEDELAIELERYMAAELPEDAANGATVRQYYIVVTQNGYQHFEAGALVSDGTYKAAETAEGTVYTLTDNLTEAEYGTLTVKADKSGAILAFAEGGELELVPYSEAPVTGVMKELKTTASLMGGVVEAEFTLTFTSDGKALVRGAVAANTIEVTADWQLVAEGLPSVSFTNVSNGTIGFGWGADGSVTFTWTGDLGAAGEQSVVFSMSASELSDLQ